MTTESIPLQWTAPAEEALEAFFARRLTPEKLDGADAAEVREDLRAHLEEELRSARVQTVTLDALQRALGTLGEPLPEVAAHSRAWDPPPFPRLAGSAHPNFMRRTPRRPGTFRKPGWYLFWAVVLPLFTFLFEVITRWCADGFFDPMPDWPHHLLVLSVPAAGLLVHRVITKRQSRRRAVVVSWVAGMAAASALFYSLLFVPMLPFALIGVIVWGLGLLCYAPVGGFFGLINGLTVLREYRTQAGSTAKRPAVWGFVLGLLFIAVLELPPLVTEIALARVAGAPAVESVRAGAARLIRRWGSEEALLAACYELNGRAFSGSGVSGPVAFVWNWFQPARSTWDLRLDEAQSFPARDLYFRTTGVPFNATKPPRRLRGLFSDISGPGGRQFDGARGGSRVAGVIDGLSLAGSRLDWHGEAATGLAWGEWTLTFSNTNAEAHEARCLIALPPGGFVSRVTLWVNGEMQEAAYSTTSQVRAAYQKVAVQQRRDPVLVTQTQPGSVMVQAFPVPAHGELKTRITFTGPADGSGRLWLPAITEKNFSMPASTEHALWAQADSGTLAGPEGVPCNAATEQGRPVLTAGLPSSSLAGGGVFLTWNSQPAPLVWCEDVNAPDTSRILVHRRGDPVKVEPRPIAVVIDGSRGLNPCRRDIEQALQTIGDNAQAMKVFIPGETAEELSSDTETLMLSSTFIGGRDNTPALRAALDWLRGRERGLLVWLHGPQPISSKTTFELEQILDRSPTPFTICDVPLAAGENTISPVFNARPRVRCDGLRYRAGTLAGSLKAYLNDSGGSAPGFTELPAGSQPPEGAVRVSDSIARWRAHREAYRLAPENPTAAGLLAAKHQVVTPWSGAVVLERAADYKANGLEQSSSKVAQEVPVIPEPSTALLCASSLLLLNRRRRPAAA